MEILQTSLDKVFWPRAWTFDSETTKHFHHVLENNCPEGVEGPALYNAPEGIG